MRKCKARKLNIHNKLKSSDGKSILMALLLLLVVVTVSVVIITAATSAAHQINSSRQHQQAYLTTSSAAEVLRDSLNGKEYTYTYTEYTRTEDWQVFTKSDTREAVSPDKEMTEFVKRLSRTIRDDAAAADQAIYSRSAKIQAEKADDVNADFLLHYEGNNSGTDNYELLVRLELPAEDDSDSGCRMELRLPIARSQTTGSGIAIIDGERWNTSSSTTVIKWGRASVSKGWSGDE